ncbi:MAG: hypothetical protein ACFFD4_16555 [Candidatus Odinarchaeota archaeon]
MRVSKMNVDTVTRFSITLLTPSFIITSFLVAALPDLDYKTTTRSTFESFQEFKDSQLQSVVDRWLTGCLNGLVTVF